MIKIISKLMLNPIFLKKGSESNMRKNIIILLAVIFAVSLSVTSAACKIEPVVEEPVVEEPAVEEPEELVLI